MNSHQENQVGTIDKVSEDRRQNEERLRLALEAADIGVWDWDILTNQVTWDANLERLFNLPPGGFDGKFESFATSIHPEDREFVIKSINQAVKNRDGYDIEFRIVWSDGSIHWAMSKGQVFYDQAGNPLRMTGVHVDITKRSHRLLNKIVAA